MKDFMSKSFAKISCISTSVKINDSNTAFNSTIYGLPWLLTESTYIFETYH